MEINTALENTEKLMSSPNGETFSFSTALSENLCSQDFFIHHETLPPGNRSSSPHYHEKTEEIVYVLKGEVTVFEGDQSEKLIQGDSACFAANSKLNHYILNSSEEKVEFLVIRKKLQNPDIIY